MTDLNFKALTDLAHNAVAKVWNTGIEYSAILYKNGSDAITKNELGKKLADFQKANPELYATLKIVTVIAAAFFIAAAVPVAIKAATNLLFGAGVGYITFTFLKGDAASVKVVWDRFTNNQRLLAGAATLAGLYFVIIPVAGLCFTAGFAGGAAYQTSV